MPYEYLCDCLKSTFRIADLIAGDTESEWASGGIVYEDYSDIMTEATEVTKIVRESLDKNCIGWESGLWEGYRH